MSDLSVEQRVSRLEGAFEQLADRLNSIGADLRGLRAEMSDLRRDLDQRFMWMLGGIGASWLTVVLAIFFHR